jgi:hypothetical protein
LRAPSACTPSTPLPPLQRALVDLRDILRMYVSAIHHLGSLYSEMNNAEMAYKVLHKAAAMRPDRKDISCSLFMAQRRYGIWNVRAAAAATSSSLLIPLHLHQAYDEMADRVVEMWKRRVLVPAGENKQKTFVRPLEPDASYDSHEAGEVRASASVRRASI